VFLGNKILLSFAEYLYKKTTEGLISVVLCCWFVSLHLIGDFISIYSGVEVNRDNCDFLKNLKMSTVKFQQKTLGNEWLAEHLVPELVPESGQNTMCQLTHNRLKSVHFVRFPLFYRTFSTVSRTSEGMGFKRPQVRLLSLGPYLHGNFDRIAVEVFFCQSP